MVISEDQLQIVQIDRAGNTDRILEPVKSGNITQVGLIDRILEDGETIVEIEFEYPAHVNVEGDFRPRIEENGLGIEIRMLQIFGVSDPEIKPKGVQVAEFPDAVEVNLRTDHEVALPIFLGQT